jgi:uncharacterized protein with NAD-binding domain and iron-sulfur cluster
MSEQPNVTVIGGGLAGLVAAWRLRERGCAVSVYESSQRWGGKAGATLREGTFEEHGYHIFPAWYRNARQVATELGILDSFRDRTQFKQLRPGEYPKFHAFTNITSARYAWQNLTAGVIPFPEAFLFFYAALDLMSQPYRYRSRLDQVTVTGFLRSRFYRTETVEDQFEELMLKGISVPTYDVSAMTMRNVMRFWVRAPEPMIRILDGDLQTKWIAPIVGKLESLGVSLYLGRRLVRIVADGGRARAVRYVDAGGRHHEERVDNLLLAIPVDKVVPLVDDELYAAAPGLADLRQLSTRAMAAVNVYFKRAIPGLPPDHVNLVGSRFGLSFIDVSQTWSLRPLGTALNLIASDFTDLEALSPDVALAALMEDLQRYLPPFGPEDVDRITLQTHVDQPLFMNDVGKWSYRSNGRTQLPNLYLAGDFARSAIDLVSMEGAISTGLRAADHIRKDLGLSPPVDVLVPPTYPEWLLALGRVALLPLAALARVWASWSDPADPSLSDVPPFDLATLPRWPLQVVDESTTPAGTRRADVVEPIAAFSAAKS